VYVVYENYSSTAQTIKKVKILTNLEPYRKIVTKLDSATETPDILLIRKKDYSPISTQIVAIMACFNI
jgi:soluble P-type ATPase